MLKNFIKRGAIYFYFNIYNNRIKFWIEIEKVRRLKMSLRSAGSNFTIKLPHRFYNPQYISIGDDFYASEGLKIEAIDGYMEQKFTPQILIGNNVTMISNCHIGCIDKVFIGNNVLIASNVFISDHFHGEIQFDALKLPPAERPLVSKGAIIIQDNVWIGENAVILPGVAIGKNAIIGANAVVTKNVAANSVVGGNPAKLIKQMG
jgi:acetyltransferase-like isoleucine patch superfamily enzyme